MKLKLHLYEMYDEKCVPYHKQIKTTYYSIVHVFRTKDSPT